MGLVLIFGREGHCIPSKTSILFEDLVQIFAVHIFVYATSGNLVVFIRPAAKIDLLAAFAAKRAMRKIAVPEDFRFTAGALQFGGGRGVAHY